MSPSRSRTAPGSDRRRGLTLTEVVVCTVLLGAVTAGTLPVLHRVRQVRRELDLRRTATVELTNALDALADRSASDLPPGPVVDLPLRAGFAERLEEPEWVVSAAAPDPRDGTVRVTARLSWLDPHGVRVRPLRLSAWVGDPSGGGDRDE